MKSPNIFSPLEYLEYLETEILRLEGKILELEQQTQKIIEIERNHLIRVKNNNFISDECILSGRSYIDLSPEKAWKQYSNPDFDFILLDVSSSDFSPENKFPEAISIPYEELPERFAEITSKNIPIMIISEDGTKSILACEFLVSRGFFNCSNISGGYKFWKGFRLEKQKSA